MKLVGGDLGYIQKGYMPTEFNEVAFSMEPGKLSTVIRTEFCCHVLKVIDRKPEGITPYAEVRGVIEKFLQKRLGRENLASHIQNLREKATIEIFLQRKE
ncbi:MAG: peptidylprolyl isomerase [Desulfobulbaceae bacterium]|nr:peptidylprolyl isomerase [Desulfobulbaceae bacterium]